MTETVRSNVVFVTLLLMLGALGAGLVLRRGTPHAAPLPVPSGETSAQASSAAPRASATGRASAAPRPASSAEPAPGPKLGRPLRVVALGWELVAPAVMANDGASPGKNSRFQAAGLVVELVAHNDVSSVENALARGGADEKGADVAVLPLPRFVASYDKLKALSPVIFFVSGFSDGGEVVLSKHPSFDALPAKGEVPLRATPGDTAAFVGLFAFQLAGVSPERVKLVGDEAEWSAITRRESKQKSEQTSGNLLLSTAEASRLVPFVAVAQASLVDKNAPALVELAKGWLAGHQLLADDAAGAARKIGEVKGAPEPLAVLARLGEIQPASLAENAELAGLAGRGAVTLETLFRQSWQIWRDAKVLAIPPEHAPVDGSIVAALVRGGGNLEPPAAPPGAKEKPRTQGKPLVTYRAPKGKLDEAALIERAGFVAGVFPRCPIAITVHPQVVPDKKASEALVTTVRERFGLSDARVAAGNARGAGAAPATIEVMPVP